MLGVELDQWGDAPIQMDEEKLDKPVGGVWHKTRILVKQNVKRCVKSYLLYIIIYTMEQSNFGSGV